MNDQATRAISRRQMLKLMGTGAAGLLLAACTPQATATEKPVEPTVGEIKPSTVPIE